MAATPAQSPSPLLSPIDTGPGCNNRCSTCPRPSPGNPEAAFVNLDGPLPDGDQLLLHGGEPTLHPAFEALLERARGAGRTMIVETNARAFSVGDRAQRAVRAGMTSATVSLHGAREASHDFLTRAPGSFRQTVAGATRVRQAGVRLSVRLVVTRSVLGELPQMAMAALGLGAIEIRFSWARIDVPVGGALPFVRGRTFVQGKPEAGADVHPTPAGDETRYDKSREWLVPRFPLAAEPLAAAVAAIARVKRLASADGVPACVAPATLRVLPTGPACFAPSPIVDEFAAPCETCTLRPRCPGVPSGYLARFGAGDLAPVTDPPR